jgi:hypothetical protein
MGSGATVTVYGGGTVETARPVTAAVVGSGLYWLPSTAPADEVWRFRVGSLVRCVEPDGVLVAVGSFDPLDDA